eukprot:5072737-Pyramimonas_sp.AAC.1
MSMSSPSPSAAGRSSARPPASPARAAGVAEGSWGPAASILLASAAAAWRRCGVAKATSPSWDCAALLSKAAETALSGSSSSSAERRNRVSPAQS